MKIATMRNEGRITTELAITLGLCLLTGGFFTLKALACQNRVMAESTQKAPCSDTSTSKCTALTNPPPQCTYYVGDAYIFCDCGSGNCEDTGVSGWHTVWTYKGTCEGSFCNNNDSKPINQTNNWASLKQTFGCE